MASAKRPIVFFGSSGYAVSFRDLMRRPASLEPLFDVVAYIDDFRGDTGIEIDGAPVISFARWERDLRDVPCLVTLGDPASRRTIAQRLFAAGATQPAVYDPDDAGDATIGAGTYVTAGVRLGAGARVGAFVQIMPFVEVPPGAIVGDFVTLCPRVILSGNVIVGDDAFLGAGCRIAGGDVEPVIIGRGARVAPGAIVDRSIGDRMRAYGEPMRVIDGMHVIG